MRYVDKPVTKIDNSDKTSGRAKYIADYKMPGMLYGAMVRSSEVHARIKAVHYPEMEDGYVTVDASDLKHTDYLRDEKDGQRIFAQDEVNYIGEGISMICGPDKKKARYYAENTTVEYEALPAVTDMMKSDIIQVSYGGEKGNVSECFERYMTYEESFSTGYHEHVYLETNGMLGLYDNGKYKIYGSMQNPYYIKTMAAQVFGTDPENVDVIAATTGGGFGGKEDYPSLVACQTLAAAVKTGKPVSFVLGRREDIIDSVKRHPARIDYKAAIDENNMIKALSVSVTFDGGAYQTVSGTVMQRCLITSTGVYDIPNVKLYGKVMKTNKVPTGAFRGFGAPQSFFAIETFMDHLAEKLSEDPLSFKTKHMVTQGSRTSTNGIFKYPVKLPEMIKRACELTDYNNKYEKYKNQTGRYRKGIGIAIAHHGCGFTGSAEKDFLKSVASIRKYKDGTVEILASSTDMGQGVRTAFIKIVAETLDISFDRVICENPDTDRVPNSGPTVASRSVIIVGKLLERAAKRLLAEWKDGEEQTITEHYVHPEMIPWDLESFSGDPYPTYSWIVNVVEVQVDMFTGETTITDACGVADVGKTIDETIIKGQIEGGLVQGIGYGSMENMEDRDGRLLQTSYTDYMIPTSMDVSRIKTDTVDNYYENGPFGAKGAGELTILCGAPAVVQAIEQATGKKYNVIPVTPEKIMCD